MDKINFRADDNLAFMLRYENIARFEDNAVYILDRRIYPTKVEFVKCETHGEVAKAIADMVTQSAGPYTAAAMGMALAAYECRDKNEKAQLEFLEKAAHTIYTARPTTTKRMRIITDGCINSAKNAFLAGENPSDAIVNYSINSNNLRYGKIEKMAEYLVDMFPKNGKILTQCFGETIVGQMLKIAKNRNLDLKIFCAETRPYFQGARLTATVAYEQGFDTTVISDNMAAFAIKQEKIDLFTSAADVICRDGYVVNKVGTYQLAIVSKYSGIPYFVTGAPDIGHETVNSTEIEFRDPEFTLQAMGVRTAREGVRGYYPSFDITPPELISGVVTEDGIYSPYDLNRYFQKGNGGEYQIVI